jgi:hypothetical protein
MKIAWKVLDGWRNLPSDDKMAQPWELEVDVFCWLKDPPMWLRHVPVDWALIVLFWGKDIRRSHPKRDEV